MSFEQPPRVENQESEAIEHLKSLLKEQEHALDEYVDFRRAGNIPAMERARDKANSYQEEIQRLLRILSKQK
jgi:hypothetical protein